jgi:hypothetical protein
LLTFEFATALRHGASVFRTRCGTGRKADDSNGQQRKCEDFVFHVETEFCLKRRYLPDILRKDKFIYTLIATLVCPAAGLHAHFSKSFCL